MVSGIRLKGSKVQGSGAHGFGRRLLASCCWPEATDLLISCREPETSSQTPDFFNLWTF